MPKSSSFTLPQLHGHFGRGTNANRVTVNGIDLYYSYKTLVAFRSDKSGLVVHQNDWRQTTGGHLNAIDGGSTEARKARVDAKTFAKLFAKATGV